MVFTFGKYAGFPLTDVPASYLCYAIESFTMPEPLICQCRAELSRRLGLQPGNQVAAEDVDLRLLIRQTYRDLAKKYHPDRQGSNEAMQALNDYYQALTQ